jgi:hypothetical protein
MRYASLARVAALSCVAGLFVSFTACTIPTADDVHARGSSSAFLRNTTDYRAVDNAIYDVLSEMYPAYTISLVEAPEREFHRWAATSDEFSTGTDRQRIRIEARPWQGSDGHWAPDVAVKTEVAMQQSQFQPKAPGSFGSSPWLEGGRNAKVEARIANEVNKKLRAWRSAGSPDPGNRRDEWLNSASAGGR